MDHKDAMDNMVSYPSTLKAEWLSPFEIPYCGNPPEIYFLNFSAGMRDTHKRTVFATL